MGSVLTALSLTSVGAVTLMWIVQTLRHRSHLAQCLLDLRRHRRLDARLVGCVTEIDFLLDDLPADSRGSEVPALLVGHATYLYALRREAQDNVANLGRHTAQLRWPDGYLGRATLAGRRCEVAHGALISAFDAMARAAREYERGIASALKVSGDGASARKANMPVRLLDESSAEEVAQLREACEAALVRVLDACGRKTPLGTPFDLRWPIWRSEVSDEPDPYSGEIRPMRWSGAGPQPVLHVDAR